MAKRRSLVAIATGLLIFASAKAFATDLKLLASWNKNNWPSYVVGDQFVKNVAKLGKGKITIRISGPEVVPPFEQLQPVKSGVFDILFTHGVYHMGSKGLAATMDALRPDPVAKRDSGVWEYLDQYYQKTHGLKLLAIPVASTQGYHIFTKEPLSPEGDLRGRKIRGTQTYHGVIHLLGGEPVVMPASQIYSALDKGVIDGAAQPAAGMLSMKHYEVSKYKIRPTFGTTSQLIVMNLESFNKLNAEEKQILLQAGYRTELEMPWIGDQIQAEEDTALVKLGVKITRVPAEKIPAMRKAFAESNWANGLKCCGEAAKELRAIATKAGLTW